MPDYPWYEETCSPELEQGDCLDDCLQPETPMVEGDDEHQVVANSHDVIVMTQSCDLAQRGNRNSSDLVMVCPIYTIDHWLVASGVTSQNGRKDYKKKLRSGAFVAFHPLEMCELPGVACPHLVVGFNGTFSVRRSYIDEVASKMKARRRLLPPYREHLAQAFARYFMRVGLPIAMSEIP